MLLSRFASAILMTAICAGCDQIPRGEREPQRVAAAPEGMVTIPAGPFLMGTTAAGNNDATPLHEVVVSEFNIDTVPVTNSQYAACVAASTCSAPMRLGSNARESYYNNVAYADYPVVYVSWSQAKTYCTWLGKRLPTEAEWEKAGRGGCEGGACGQTAPRNYPWGDDAPSCDRANHTVNETYGFRYCAVGGDTEAVGFHTTDSSVYGVHDMAGNVLQWVEDWYDSSSYAGCGQRCTDPKGPGTGKDRVLRGGAWSMDAKLVQVWHRSAAPPTQQMSIAGFRCAK